VRVQIIQVWLEAYALWTDSATPHFGKPQM